MELNKNLMIVRKKKKKKKKKFFLIHKIKKKVYNPCTVLLILASISFYLSKQYNFSCLQFSTRLYIYIQQSLINAEL